MSLKFLLPNDIIYDHYISPGKELCTRMIFFYSDPICKYISRYLYVFIIVIYIYTNANIINYTVIFSLLISQYYYAMLLCFAIIETTAERIMAQSGIMMRNLVLKIVFQVTTYFSGCCENYFQSVELPEKLLCHQSALDTKRFILTSMFHPWVVLIQHFNWLEPISVFKFQSAYYRACLRLTQ